MFADDDAWGDALDEDACPAAHASFYGRPGAARTPPRAQARAPLTELSPNSQHSGSSGACGGVGSTPRRRRGVDWASAARRVDYFISALREAEEAAEAPARDERHAPQPLRRSGSGSGNGSAALMTPPPQRSSPGSPGGGGELRSTWHTRGGGSDSDADAGSDDDDDAHTNQAPFAAAAACAFGATPRLTARPPLQLSPQPASPPQQQHAAHTHTHAQAQAQQRTPPRAAAPYEDDEDDDDRGGGGASDDGASYDGDGSGSFPYAQGGGGDDAAYGVRAAASWREQALSRRVDALERALSRQQLAGALSEMRAATGDLAGAALASAAARGSPGAEPRRRAEVAEEAAAEAVSERDAALSRCARLEDELCTAVDAMALLRRRAEEAEARADAADARAAAAAGAGATAGALPPQPQQPHAASARVREEVAAAVAAAEALPADAARRRLRALRLRWHPDKHADALSGLATEVSQALNEEMAARARRAQARGDTASCWTDCEDTS
jgi:hypothetical protein